MSADRPTDTATAMPDDLTLPGGDRPTPIPEDHRPMHIDAIHDRLAAIIAEADRAPAARAEQKFAAIQAAVLGLLAEIRCRRWGIREAADYLGVSRAWLFGRVDAGEIVAAYEGDGRCTFAYADLRACKDQCNAETGAALDELARIGQEAGWYDEEPPS